MSLASLKHTRSTLQARSNSLGASISRLTSLQARAGEAEAALRDFDADASELMAAWARSGAGEPPTVDHVERAKLMQSVARAKAEAEHAGKALAQLTSEAQEVATSLVSIGADIERAAMDALIGEHQTEMGAFTKFVEQELHPRLARLSGLHDALAEKGRQHWGSGREDQGRAILSSVEHLPRPTLDLDPPPKLIFDASSDWIRRFTELTGDAPTNVVALPSAAA